MLRVVVTLVPFGDETKARELGQMTIANTGGRRGLRWGEYGVSIWEDNHGQVRHIPKFDRRKGFWALVKRSIEEYLK